MKTEQIQKEIFEALVTDPSSVKMFNIGDREFITVNGYNAYAVGDYLSMFKLDGIKRISDPQYFKTKKDVLIEPTNITLHDDSSGKFAQLYLSDDFAEDFHVYIGMHLLENFDYPELRTSSPISRVLVYECGDLKGVVLPVKPNQNDAELSEIASIIGCL